MMNKQRKLQFKQNIKMHKKGQDALNVIELVVAAIFILGALFLVGYMENLGERKVVQELSGDRAEYQTKQLLRTFIQTPLNDVTVGFAINRYFEINNFKNEPEFKTLPLEEQTKLLEESALLEKDLKGLSGKVFSHIAKQLNARPVYVLAFLRPDSLTKDWRDRYLFLHGISTKTTGKPLLLQEDCVQLPAYFEHKNVKPGTYYIEVCIRITED